MFYRCKGSVKTTTLYELLDSTPHQCVPNVAEVEVQKAKYVCKKRAREEISITVRSIYNDEFRKILNKGYDLAAELPTYDKVRSGLGKERRKSLGTSINPAKSADVFLNDDQLTFSDGTNFLLMDLNENGTRCLVFSGSTGRHLLKTCTDFFLDGTFKSCPKQFKQIYTIHTDVGSSEEETNILPVAYALLENKTKGTYIQLFEALQNWGWSPKYIKLDFEMAAVEAVRLIFPESFVSGCNYHYNQCLWRQIQNLGLTTDYRDIEEVRTICRMCSALALIPIEKLDDAWLLIMSLSPTHHKLEAFLDYFVDQWMENDNLPPAAWNVYGQRHRSNNPVEGWNSKFNKQVGVNHPNVYFLVNKLKYDAEEVNAKIMAQDLGLEGQKRRKKYIKLDSRIQTIISRYEQNNNLFQCMRALAYATKFE